MRKLLIPLLAMGMVVFTDVSYAAFGAARSSGGVSRSYSRPATPSYNKPAATYSAPASTSNQQPSRSYNNSSNYRDNSYQAPAPRQNSAMRDIGVTAAGVAGGVLAASAITALVSSPNHGGMYTHPQYPGQYFNQQGQAIAGPAQAAPQQQYQQSQPYVVVQQQKESGGFFSFLWGALWAVLQLIFFVGVVGAIAFGVYKLFLMGKKSGVQDKIREQLELKPSTRPDFEDLDARAMAIFYEFQKNSDNAAWVEANTKYLPVDECLSPPSKILQYEHRTIDCAVEQGKVRGSVLYRATLNDGTGDVEVNQYWNFEKELGVWKLIGFEQHD